MHCKCTSILKVHFIYHLTWWTKDSYEFLSAPTNCFDAFCCCSRAHRRCSGSRSLAAFEVFHGCFAFFVCVRVSPGKTATMTFERYEITKCLMYLCICHNEKWIFVIAGSNYALIWLLGGRDFKVLHAVALLFTSFLITLKVLYSPALSHSFCIWVFRLIDMRLLGCCAKYIVHTCQISRKQITFHNSFLYSLFCVFFCCSFQLFLVDNSVSKTVCSLSSHPENKRQRTKREKVREFKKKTLNDIHPNIMRKCKENYQRCVDEFKCIFAECYLFQCTNLH